MRSPQQKLDSLGLESRILSFSCLPIPNHIVARLARCNRSKVSKTLKKHSIESWCRPGGPKISSWMRRAERPNWNGGKTVRRGYVLISVPGHPRANKRGYVTEHVLSAEMALRRHIKPNEVVHHINGVRFDNNPDNLKVLTQAEHLALHNRNKARAARSGSRSRIARDRARVLAPGHRVKEGA